jgi:hypothetical protein
MLGLIDSSSAFAAVDLGSGEWPLSSRLPPLIQSGHRMAYDITGKVIKALGE